jgi:glycine betaine/proline transport system permease protein
MEWIDTFPAMGSDTLRELKKSIDAEFRALTREYGEFWERVFDPLRNFLVGAEDLLLATPWPIVILVVLGVAWLATRNWRIVAGTAVTLLLIGWFGMWEDTTRTVSMILVATLVALVVGLPIGILMSRHDGVQPVVAPVLDVMQTTPSFVYLIPVVMLLGIGKVPGLIAVVIYAIPPVIRFTNLGIRLQRHLEVSHG